MKHILVLFLLLLATASCARKVEVRAHEFTFAERYSYVKADDGRLYVVAASAKDFDEAMKMIRPGPASVDKVNLWVITPLKPKSKR